MISVKDTVIEPDNPDRRLHVIAIDDGMVWVRQHGRTAVENSYLTTLASLRKVPSYKVSDVVRVRSARETDLSRYEVLFITDDYKIAFLKKLTNSYGDKHDPFNGYTHLRAEALELAND